MLDSGKPRLLLWAGSGGVELPPCRGDGGKSRLPETAYFPQILIIQKKEWQPAWIFFRALPQLGGRSRQALALSPRASKFNSARPTKKMPELAMLKHRSGSSLGSFEKITATIMATTN